MTEVSFLHCGSAAQRSCLVLPVGDLDAPADSIPRRDVLGRGRHVCIEEDGIGVLSVRISTEDHGDCLISRTMIRRELMDQQPDLLSITREKLWYMSLDVGVPPSLFSFARKSVCAERLIV